MINKLWLIASLFILAACSVPAPPVKDPTEVAPAQPIAVTRTIPPTFTSTPGVKTPTSTPIPSELVGLDPSYFDGIVVITQYLTYLDLGIYKEAYRLLHPDKPNIKREEDFILAAEMAYQSVEIKTIQPYFIWAKNHGLNASGDPENQKRYFVEFTVEGEPGWWPDDDVNLIFTLEMNDQGWRIISQDTIAKNTNQSLPVTTAWIAPEFFDGIILITKYYTYLDLGLFEEAYNLLSASNQGYRDKEDWLEIAPSIYISVRIIKIEPFFIFSRQHSNNTPTPEMGDVRRFYVEIIPEGEGAMSGSVMNGVVSSQFISLIQENSAWKIDGFSTAP